MSVGERFLLSRGQNYEARESVTVRGQASIANLGVSENLLFKQGFPSGHICSLACNFHVQQLKTVKYEGL